MVQKLRAKGYQPLHLIRTSKREESMYMYYNNEAEVEQSGSSGEILPEAASPLPSKSEAGRSSLEILCPGVFFSVLAVFFLSRESTCG